MLIKPLLILVFMTPYGEMKIATAQIERCSSPYATQAIAERALANQNYFVKVKAKCLTPEPLAQLGTLLDK